MTKLFKIYDRFLDVCGVVPGIIVVFIVLGISSDVILRNFGISGIEAIIELIEIGLYVLTFVGAAYVLRLGRHVTVDVIITSLPESIRYPVAIAASCIMVVVSLFVLVFSARVTFAAFQDNSMIVESLIFPEWYLLALMPPAAVLLTIESLRCVWIAVFRRDEFEPSKLSWHDRI